MNKKAIIIFLIFIIILSCEKQNKCNPLFNVGFIKGSVREYSSNKSIEDVKIYTTPTTSESITDSKGNFELYIPQKGEYELKAEKYGYYLTINNINIENKNELDINILSKTNWILEPGGINGTRMIFNNGRIVVIGGNIGEKKAKVIKHYYCKNDSDIVINCNIMKDMAALRIGLFASLDSDQQNTKGLYKMTDGEHNINFKYHVFDNTVDHYITKMDTIYIYNDTTITDTVYNEIISDTVYVDSTNISIELRVEGGSVQGYFWNFNIK